MKKLVIGAFAAALIAATAAFAQDHQDNNHHDKKTSNTNTMSGPAHHDNTMSGPATGSMNHMADHHDTMNGPAGGAMNHMADQHGAMGGPMNAMHRNDHAMMRQHDWHHGDRLPRQYWRGATVDWHAHHLRRPPRGYHWVQVDGDYVLAAVATGFILESVLANH